jgi:hypothetical protein
LQAKLGEDAFDAAGADRKAALAQLLGDDLGGGIGIEKAVTHDLLDDLIGAAVMGLGPALLIAECQHAAVLQELTQLKVALPAEAELVGCGGGAHALALSFEEHRELAQDNIGGRRTQGAAGTFEDEGVCGNGEHTSGKRSHRCQ